MFREKQQKINISINQENDIKDLKLSVLLQFNRFSDLKLAFLCLMLSRFLRTNCKWLTKVVNTFDTQSTLMQIQIVSALTTFAPLLIRHVGCLHFSQSGKETKCIHSISLLCCAFNTSWILSTSITRVWDLQINLILGCRNKVLDGMENTFIFTTVERNRSKIK